MYVKQYAQSLATDIYCLYNEHMLQILSPVLYKCQPAVVTEIGEKYTIQFCTSPATETGKKAVYGTQKVRERDVILLSENKISSLDALLKAAENQETIENIKNSINETWELLVSDEETAAAEISFSELADYSGISADNIWAFYSVLLKDIHFSKKAQNDKLPSFIPNTQEEIDAISAREKEKEAEAEIKAGFISRLQKKQLILPQDAKYMQEVEAFALGLTDKSKVLNDAGLKATPEKAHKLLLDTKIWTIAKNPYPSRAGLSMQSATERLESPKSEERVHVETTAWAIDNEWSTDPDDAIAFDGTYYWIHIADPASTVTPDSKADISARNRGATLYIPEGAARMLCENALEDYALGLKSVSNALSFRIKLDDDGNIQETSVLKTTVHVERLTYESADEKKDSPELAPLFEFARKNIERRKKLGAVFIDMPEIHIRLAESGEENIPKVEISPVNHPESAVVVREMMLLAGEGAARFAFKNNIPFPFVSQDAPDLPKDLPEGLAGQYRLRHSMRSRSVGVTPSNHAGLGLSMYSQVTSPLRRYSDLIAHQQLRAFIDGKPLIDKDEMLTRISAGDAAAGATIKAERKTNLHWILVYLLQNPNWRGKGVIVDNKGNQAVVIIPELAQEATVNASKKYGINEEVTVKAANINLTELTVLFEITQQ